MASMTSVAPLEYPMKTRRSSSAHCRDATASRIRVAFSALLPRPLTMMKSVLKPSESTCGRASENGRMKSATHSSDSPGMMTKRSVSRCTIPMAEGVSVELIDPRTVAQRNLDMLVYDIAPLPGIELTSHWETLARLRRS